MKKLAFTLFAISILLFSCSSDESIDNSNKILEHVEITNNSNNDIEIEYFSNDGKFINSYKNNSLTHENTYNSNDLLIKKTYYQNNEIILENTFTYNENGVLNSVHEFNTFNTPQNQDRPITWIDNKMIIPYLNNNGNVDVYEFSFNDSDLLINFKHKLEDGYIFFNSNYEYDANDNVIRKYGTNLYQSFDVTYTYDDKNNPYFLLQKRYKKIDFIMLGKRIQNTNIYLIDDLITSFGKNNYLSGKDIINNTLIQNYSQPFYDENTTTKIIYKNRINAFEIVHAFFYED